MSPPTNVAKPVFCPRSKRNSCTKAAPPLWGWSAGIAVGTLPGLGSLSCDGRSRRENCASGSGRSEPNIPSAGLTVT